MLQIYEYDGKYWHTTQSELIGDMYFDRNPAPKHIAYGANKMVFSYNPSQKCAHQILIIKYE